MITWCDVIKCFNNTQYKAISKNMSQTYCNFEYLQKNMIADDEKTLYLVKISQLSEVRIADNVSIILQIEDFAEYERMEKVGRNSLYLQEKLEECGGIIKLMSLFRSYHKAEQFLISLYADLAEDKGVQYIIEEIASFLEQPVCLLDTAFRYIAKSESYKPDEKKTLLPEILEKEGFDHQLLGMYKNDGGLDRLLNSSTLFTYKIEEEHAYFIPIRIGKIKAAYFVVYSDKDDEIDKLYGDIIQKFSDILSIEMSKNNFYLFNKGNYYNYIFSVLLSGENVDLEDIRMRLKIYEYNLLKNMYLIEIATKSSQISQKHRDTIAESMRTMFRNSIYVFKNDRLFFLVSRSDKDLIKPSEMESWETVLKSQQMIGAITGPFEDFTQIDQQIRKTELVLEVVKTTDRELLSFEQQQTEAMIFSAGKKEELKLFIYEPVKKLVSYDKLHGTDLVNTLKEYLRHPKGIQEICDALCIHKNTLYKRLNRIADIMKCDFKDGYTIMRIEISFVILKMTEGVL